METEYQTKFARLMAIARAIKRRGKTDEKLDRQRLAEEYGGVAEETISRYIGFLRDNLNYPIRYDPREESYVFYHQSYTDLDNNFSVEEIMLVIMGLDSLKSFGGSEIYNLQSKLISLLPDQFESDLIEMKEELNFEGAEEEVGNINDITIITEATLEETMIKFDYFPAYLEQDKMECEIMPYGVTWQIDRCYLVGWDPEDERIINYRLDRTDNIELSSRSGSVPEDFNLREYVARSQKMFFGELQKVVLQFNNSLRPLVEDKFEAEYYDITEETDKHFTIQTTIRGIEGLKIWLLSLGTGVKVMKPDSLRQDLKETAEEMVTHHSKSS